ncbi:PREDICTED: protein DCL, chloroplastic-like [Tarenaya hassleriana]|uniref:protein DCL, chloroplastic-like n=1 Tax=Tarenaya hassleriana TaxID=28532 RepID=UPI00053C3F7A|nr:PREDICTED: protein DCL, chloroplastic-like [Tarenaya hassleriana]
MASVSQPVAAATAASLCFCGGFSLSTLSSSPVTLYFPSGNAAGVRLRVRAVRTESDGALVGSNRSYGSDLLRRQQIEEEDQGFGSEEDENGEDGEAEDEFVDWEDKILEVTVPLVGFVRMILHSGKYGSGDRLSPEHERMVVERLLPYHPEYEKKIGPGIDHIMVGHHPDFERSRCLFIARKDGEIVDFSYWKCIKGLIRKNYPLYADSFILRHFRKRRLNR